MASKIKVDQIQTADGSGTIALQNQLSGMTTASVPTLDYTKLPAGSIIQTVHMVNTRSGNTSSTSTSYVHLNNGAANYSLAITPKYSNSYIMGVISLPGVAQKKNNASVAFAVFKNDSEWEVLDSHLGYHNQGTGNIHAGHQHFTSQFIDTNVGSTNATTYDVRAKCTAGGEFRIFDNHITTNYRTHFTLMEIKQ
tara:strand:- start:122 stop:706 length:585 start_codon:yes stop_codon:yes gene_type:complete